MSHEIVAEIRTDLNRMGNPDHADRVKQYFKEPIETHGLTAPKRKSSPRSTTPESRETSRKPEVA